MLHVLESCGLFSFHKPINQANFHDHLNETTSVKIYSIEGSAGQSGVSRHQPDVHYTISRKLTGFEVTLTLVKS